MEMAVSSDIVGKYARVVVVLLQTCFATFIALFILFIVIS